MESPDVRIEFLEELIRVTSLDALHEYILDFFSEKLRLSNCVFVTESKTSKKVMNAALDEAYNAVQSIVELQLKATRAPFVTGKLCGDFMFKTVPNVDQLPQNVFAVPLLVNNDFAGYLLCFSDKNVQQLIESCSWLCGRLALAVQRINSYAAVKHSALTDSLTGLYNRIYFEAVASNGIVKAQKDKHPTSIILFDIDDFKVFNDTKGHLAGDGLLRDLGSLLSTHLAEKYTLCRYGGEEFIVFLPEIKNDVAESSAEELRMLVEKNLAVTISVGVATCLNSSVDLLTLVREADTALYKAKQTGKNKVVQRIIVDKNVSVIDVEDARAVGKT